MVTQSNHTENLNTTDSAALAAQATDLRFLSAAMIPSCDGNDELQTEIVQNFGRIYSDLDADSQKNLLLFLKVLRILSRLRFLKDWRKMSVESRHRFFEFVESFPVGLIRAGFFGIRSLLFLSYYATESAWQRIGYAGPIVDRSIYSGKGVTDPGRSKLRGSV